MSSESPRHLGLVGATAIGVGAIVGGGILAIAGPAFVLSGPSAILAFVINGIIAWITALSFAELGTRFPESGGTYAFARRVLSLRAAFMVGWVVWFASIVAAVLYALGFAAFLLAASVEGGRLFETTLPTWISGRWSLALVATGATLFFTLGLLRGTRGGGTWINAIKLVVFAALVLGGAVAVFRGGADQIAPAMTPFFAGGFQGFAAATGLTFIALQGFDLIAAVGGEVRDPRRNLPRAMVLSLAIAVLIYIPLLFEVSVAGTAPGVSIQEASAAGPSTVVAEAARMFLGIGGYWLVLIAGSLAMASALQANLLASSRVAQAMARDRTLPGRLERHNQAGAPAAASLATAAIVVGITLAVGEVAAAGAAASLVFLVTFSLAHLVTILARRRSTPRDDVFLVPWFPVLPIIGGIACIGLSIYQALSVTSAGMVIGIWMAIGSALYISMFAERAQIRDAAAEASDPHMLRTRGRSPLVLVPVANPDTAGGLLTLAQALAPPQFGRVLLLSVVRSAPETPAGEDPSQIGYDLEEAVSRTQQALFSALVNSSKIGISPEALVTIAPEPWPEIVRVSRNHGCMSILLGLGDLTDEIQIKKLEALVGAANCDVLVLRAPKGWSVDRAERILVPISRRGGHDIVRARLLSSLDRSRKRSIRYLRVLPTGASEEAEQVARRLVQKVVDDETNGTGETLIERGDPIQIITARAAESDLLVLGFQRAGARRALGDFVSGLAAKHEGAILVISHRDSSRHSVLSIDSAR